MSVLVTFGPKIFLAYTPDFSKQPALCGVWTATGTLAGDVSGGDSVITFDLLPFWNKYLFSLEAWNTWVSGVSVGRNGFHKLFPGHVGQSEETQVQFRERITLVAGGGEETQQATDRKFPALGIIFPPSGYGSPFMSSILDSNPGAAGTHRTVAYGYLYDYPTWLYGRARVP